MASLSERHAVRRLHDRFGFGASPGDLESSYGDAVDRLLARAEDTGSAPPKVAYAPRPKKDDKAAVKQWRQQRAEQQKLLVAWWLDRMTTADGAAATVERLTWFWHGHFATSARKVKQPAFMLAQNETFRRHALGEFTDLARALIVDPAMIQWLDGNDNRKGAPNENLAREFMELFALGIGHYTEDDVQAAAQALTGWKIGKDGKASLVAKRRDDAPVTLFGAKRTFTATSLAEHVLAQPESAPFVVGRLWFRLVSPDPPDDATMQRLLKAYGPRRDIRATLQAITAEQAFRDESTTLVKQPVEWLAGLLRAYRVRPSQLEPKARTKLLRGLLGLGQVPFMPPSVGGWPPSSSFLTTAGALTRLRLAKLVAEQADPKSLSGLDAVGRALGVDDWSDRTRAALTKTDDPAQVAALAACAPEYVVSR